MTNSTITEPTEEKPSLLFVDDEPSILTSLRVVFRTGYNITVTTDGFEAVELLKTKKFDVIVSDQRMPKMTGVELLQHAHDLSPNTVRILLTGYSDTDAILGAINDVEVHRFLQKPWDNTKLKQTINEAIELAKNLAAETPKSAELPTVESAGESPTSESTEEAPPEEKDLVLIVDAKSTLFSEAQKEMIDKVEWLHATSVKEVFDVLENKPVSAMICSFDVQSEADRTFLQMLKKEHPYIFVIAICDSTDSTRLIELINHAKIFRFIKKPARMTQLSRYVLNAISQAEAIKNNPALVRAQQTEAMSDSLANSASAKLLQGYFARANQSVASHFSKLFGFFKRS
ncbi:MAG: response regulator [Pseudomonadota bacterium]